MSRFLRPSIVACVCLLIVCLAAPATLAGASLDIYPRSCPNTLNIGARLMVTAIVADAEFDASQIDVESLEMTRTGVAGSVTPFQGLGLRRNHRLVDIAAPPLSETCRPPRTDGRFDLRVLFRQMEVVEELQLRDSVNTYDSVELCVSGQTYDGNSFEACDRVIVREFFETLAPFDGIGTRPLLRM